VRPSLTIINRQRKFSFNLPFLRRVSDKARPACAAAVLFDEAPLSSLAAVEISILNDADIGKVHDEFFLDPSPTDVITFPYGEILLGAGVIAENARQFGNTPDEEAAICIIHGLLHLAGWEDAKAEERKRMHAQQEQIFKLALRML